MFEQPLANLSKHNLAKRWLIRPLLYLDLQDFKVLTLDNLVFDLAIAGHIR